MLIRDLEAKVDIEMATIHFYGKACLFAPQRKVNCYREYKKDNPSTLLKRKLLRRLGCLWLLKGGFRREVLNFAMCCQFKSQSGACDRGRQSKRCMHRAILFQ